MCSIEAFFILVVQAISAGVQSLFGIHVRDALFFTFHTCPEGNVGHKFCIVKDTETELTTLQTYHAAFRQMCSFSSI